MGLILIVLNLVLIGFVGFLIYTIRQLYKVSESKNMSVSELMASIEKEPDSVSHAYFYEQTGVWSTSEGIDWTEDLYANEGSKNTKLYDISAVS
jgi:hypothetical protein